MESYATGFLAAMTFPVAFGLARLCLEGVLHFMHPATSSDKDGAHESHA